MRTTRGLILVVAVVIAMLIGSAGALAKTRIKTQSASAPLSRGGTVTATLTYTPRAYYDSDIHLTITRAGQVLHSRRVTAPQCGNDCEVGYGKSIHVVDLNGDGEPEVLLDIYTGGAHCCSLTQIYSYDPGTQTYRAYQVDWGDPGYRLTTVAGQVVFLTADDRFAYEFTDFAASGLPLALYRFDGSKLVDVTLRYPALIAKDAAGWLKAYTAQAADKYDDSVGVIAAWAADEDELGHAAQVATYLNAQAADGHLNSGEPGSAGGTRFVKRLDAFLTRTGYLK